MIMNGIETEPSIFPKRTALLLSCQESGCIQQTLDFIHQKMNGHHPKIGPLGDVISMIASPRANLPPPKGSTGFVMHWDEGLIATSRMYAP